MKIKNIFVFIILLMGTIKGFALQCKPPVDTHKHQYIIGYGSLISEASKKLTSTAVKNNHPILIHGFKRGFIEKSINEPLGTTYLGVIPFDAGIFNGVYFELNTPEVINTFDKRESSYCRLEVPHQQLKALDNTPLPDGQYWLYITSHTHHTPTKNHPITQSYVDVFLTGCLEMQEKFKLHDYAKQCITETSYWSVHWVNDRIFPRRPHVYQPNAYLIDALLKENIPSLFQKIRIEELRPTSNVKEEI